MRPSNPADDVAWRRRATLVALALGFALFTVLLWPQPLLFDGDSYLHLAIARDFLQNGLPDGLRWARFSAMADGFGDKELLFHLWLVPWIALFGAELGGKLALAGQNALLLATLTNLGARSGRAAALAVPLLVFGAAGTFALRLIRLRPETLGLVILLWATWLAADRRYRLIALLSFLFALAYTAFHALLGMTLIWAGWILFSERKIEWRVIAYPLVGLLLALVVHPHFPKNIEIWAIQSIDFFRYKNELAVGTEFEPFSSMTWLTLDAAFALGITLLWWTRERRDDAGQSNAARQRAMAPFFVLVALPFFAMQMRMGRFAFFSVPFATLGAAFALQEYGYRIGPRLRLPAGFSLSSRWLLVFAVASTFWVLANLRVNLLVSGALDPASRQALRGMAAAIPKDARVAASWQDAEQYVFWAPHARYLNLYDPVFMRVTHPQRHQLQRRLFDGDTPDVPLTLVSGLDSEWLAFRTPGRERLLRRLVADPRLQRVRGGLHSLYRVRTGANAGFVLDFSLRPERQGKGASRPLPYPRPLDARLRRVEGYVDATRLGPVNECALFSHRFQKARPGVLRFEFAPYGPSTLWIDGAERAKISTSLRAVLGQGVEVSTHLEAGEHLIAVRTCPDSGQAGFYLRRVAHP